MDNFELMRSRHSVRSFLDKPISDDIVTKLQNDISDINLESGLSIQLFTNEPQAFRGNATHYGMFKCCKNYFTISGPDNHEEAVGYYGQKLVLKAQALGLNTCWVALTYRKSTLNLSNKNGEKLYIVIALGYGSNSGAVRKSKKASAVSNISENSPEWFKRGVEAALLAPTAMNLQQFSLELEGDTVKTKSGIGKLSKIDLGIVKYQFELGAGISNFTWG